MINPENDLIQTWN